jgi:hypothetical protein
MVTISKALEWVMHGYPARMNCWNSDEYLRYSELQLMFVMHNGPFEHLLENIEIEADTFCDPCWVLGKWHPMGKSPIWDKEKGNNEGE